MKKINYNKGRFVIANSDYDYDYADYVSSCYANNCEPKDETSHDFYSWCNDCAIEDWENDMDNIKTCKQYNVPVVISGSLGLWDGTHEIYPVRCETVYDAIQKCISKDTNVCKVYFDNGHIEVEVYHHDGCNCFTINALNKRGLAKQNAEYAPHDIKRLPYLYNI